MSDDYETWYSQNSHMFHACQFGERDVAEAWATYRSLSLQSEIEGLRGEVERYKDSIAKKLLAVRAALLDDDITEAYHHLYSIVDPDFCNENPWTELEQLQTVNDVQHNTTGDTDE